MFNFYTKKELLPTDIEFVRNINAYYNLYGKKLDANDKYDVKVLRDIEGGKIVSSDIFIGKFVDAGVYRTYLSTGSKACLLIDKFNDICFDLCECGNNVLSFLLEHAERGIAFYDGYISVLNVSSKICINRIECNNRLDVLEALK